MTASGASATLRRPASPATLGDDLTFWCGGGRGERVTGGRSVQANKGQDRHDLARAPPAEELKRADTD